MIPALNCWAGTCRRRPGTSTVPVSASATPPVSSTNICSTRAHSASAPVGCTRPDATAYDHWSSPDPVPLPGIRNSISGSSRSRCAASLTMSCQGWVSQPSAYRRRWMASAASPACCSLGSAMPSWVERGRPSDS